MQETGHIHQDCPLRKKKKDKKEKRFNKKVFVATWSGSDDSSNKSESEEEKTNICFMAKSDSEDKACLHSSLRSFGKWYLNSGCSRHMMGDKSLFSSLKAKDEGNVNFEDNFKGKVIGINITCNSSFLINDVLLVEGFRHNLLSISQLCDKGFKINFYSLCYKIVDASTNAIAFIGCRHSNVYIIDLHDIVSRDLCLMSTKGEDMWL